jgi:hypothetical protein
LDILRDAIELKKLNNSLMKGSLIDDLVADTYACVYETFVSQVLPEEQNLSQVPAEQGVSVGSTTTAAPPADDNRERMKLGNVLTPQTDGPADIALTRLVMPSMAPIGLGLQINPMFMGASPSSFGPTGGNTAPAVVTKSTRAKQITRREIQRKAEGVVVRPPPIKTPTLTKKPIVVEIPTPTRDRKEYTSIDGGADLNTNEQGIMAGTRVDELLRDDADASSGLSSCRGSVHDSADDESELSDIEADDEENDIKVEQTMKEVKPGLIGGDARAPGAGPNVDSDMEIADSQDKMEVDDS